MNNSVHYIITCESCNSAPQDFMYLSEISHMSELPYLCDAGDVKYLVGGSS